MSTRHGALLDALRGVRWPARRAVGAALPGAHRSRQRGTSGEFTEYRLYRQGDDPRQLDWKLLARSDRAFVRLTDDRALVTTWLVVDGSASMAFPAPRAAPHGAPDGEHATKWDVACALAVGLGAVAHASGDPVGALVLASGGTRRFPPRTRRGTVHELTRVLNESAPGGTQPLAPALETLPVNCRTVVVSDLLGDLDATLAWGARTVAAGGMVEVVHVVAREELALPDRASLARDPETPSIEHIIDRGGHARYREAFDRFRAEAARRWRAAGAGYHEVVTGESLPRAVRAIVAGGAPGAGVPGYGAPGAGP